MRCAAAVGDFELAVSPTFTQLVPLTRTSPLAMLTPLRARRLLTEKPDTREASCFAGANFFFVSF